MEERNRTEFSKWIAKQFKLAGEELIRRSETADFTGWDGVTDISISLSIPTYKDDIEVPAFDITFSCINKKAVDDLIANSRHFVEPLTVDDRDEDIKPWTDVKERCPVCSNEVLHQITGRDPDTIRFECPACGWHRDIYADEWNGGDGK